MKFTTETFSYKKPFSLESGRILDGIRLDYAVYGKMNEDKSNVILVCHPLALDYLPHTDVGKKGWWQELIGEGKTIDTDKYCVICSNVLASDYGSTSPSSIHPKTKKPYLLNFPVVTITDMIHAQKLLLDFLQIKELKAIIGGSMGGMQTLQFALHYPNLTKTAIALACTAKTRDYTIAFNKIIQKAITKDPRFKNGHYDKEELEEEGLDGLSLARMIGYITFLSPYSMDDKFKNEYGKDDGLYELFGNYQVGRYLEYNGNNFARRFDANSYLYLSKAIDIFDLSRGFNSLQEAVAQIKAKLYLLSFKEDRLFLPYEMEEIAHACETNGISYHYEQIDSDYGHDAFLTEVHKYKHIIAQALSDTAK